MSLEIKQIGPEKFEEYFTLLREMMTYILDTGPHPGITNDYPEEQKITLEEDFKNKKFEIHIMYVDQKPIGFIGIYETYATFLAQTTVYLDDIYITESERGKGYGTQAMEYLKKLVKERNYGRIDWKTQPENKKAQEFYEKIGATNCGYIYYRIPQENYA